MIIAWEKEAGREQRGGRGAPRPARIEERQGAPQETQEERAIGKGQVCEAGCRGAAEWSRTDSGSNGCALEQERRRGWEQQQQACCTQTQCRSVVCGEGKGAGRKEDRYVFGSMLLHAAGRACGRAPLAAAARCSWRDWRATKVARQRGVARLRHGLRLLRRRRLPRCLVQAGSDAFGGLHVGELCQDWLLIGAGQDAAGGAVPLDGLPAAFQCNTGG
jgi:hypothetical protein